MTITESQPKQFPLKNQPPQVYPAGAAKERLPMNN